MLFQRSTCAVWLVAVLAHLARALTKEFQAGAVHQQVQRLGPSAQRAVVGHRQTRHCQALQAAGNALKRPQRQAID